MDCHHIAGAENYFTPVLSNADRAERASNTMNVLVPRGRTPFGQHQESTFQRHSGFEWL